MNKLKLFILSRIRKKNEKTKDVAFKKYVLFEGVEFLNSEIGDFSYVARNTLIHNTYIGKFCSIGPNVVIGYGNHPTNFVSTSPVFYQSTTSFEIKPKIDKFYGLQKVTIGNDVWIGANCFINNGIKIGDGVIIGAGSIVLKDVPPYAVVVGNPAKILRYRFEKEEIERLLILKWWEMSENTIKQNLELFSQDNISLFIEKIKKSI